MFELLFSSDPTSFTPCQLCLLVYRNCQDAWDVCRNMGIRSYPTLLIFRGNEQYEKYTGQRDLQSLVGFAIAGLPIPPSVSQSTRPPARSVVVVCVPDVYECEEEIEHRKLAASLVGIAGVYTLDCSRSPDVCKEWKLDDMPQAVWIDPAGEVVPFYPPLDGGGEPQNWGDVYSTTSLTEATLKMLPLPPSLDAERFSQFVDTPGGGKLSHNVAGTQEERAWSTIDARKACESNNEGIKRYTHYESVGHSTRGLNECKRLCEQDNACNGIDFYGNTGWCNLYTMPCATPARYDHGAQSLALKRGSGVRGIVVYFIDLTQKDPKVVELEREIRQMPHQQLERIGVMQFVVHCNELPQLCAQVRADMPEARLYKTMGHENYHGDAKAKSMLKWVHSSLTTNVIALSADDVEEILQMDPTSANGVSWFIDYYASWCPPCKEMLPHFRQASVMAGATVRFGSIDCNKYQAFCSEQGVTGYPSPAVYTANARSVAQWYDGDWDDANAFVEHINDIFNPPTTEITEHSWHNGWQADLHATKDVWLVLLTAGQWCGPCQQMNKMMKSVAKSSNGLYKVGIINCDVDRGLCDFLSVTGYPQLRRYRSSPGNDGTDGQLSGFIWNGHSFARNIINWAIEALPDGVMEMTEQTFNANVGSAGATAEAWFVTYSCPRWCRPCANWRPKQKQLAFMMGKTHRIRVAHIDCDDNRAFCNAQGIEAYPRALLYQPGIDHGQQVEIGSVDEVADYLRQVVELIPAERDAASKPPTEFDDVYNEFMQEDEIEDMYGEDDDNLDHDEF